MTLVCGEPVDPFVLPETDKRSFSGTWAKTISDPRNSAGANTGVFIVAGQSNAANYSTGPLYTPTNATKIDNLNPVDGGTYRGTDPALGASGNMASWLFRFADLIVNAGVFDRVVMVPIAVGSTSVTEWTPGGDIAGRMRVAAARCANIDLSVSAVLWQQGEADTSMTTADYMVKLFGAINYARTLGLNVPWFIGQSTYNGGVISPTVRAACQQVVNGFDIFSGADTDTLTGTAYREPTLVHFNEAGINAAAALWRDAVKPVFAP